MNRQSTIEDGIITFYVDSLLFSREAVLKCLYWYGEKFQTFVWMHDSGTYALSLRPLPDSGIGNEELRPYMQKFERDLIDFQLRDIIVKETGNIRDLLVAKAFSTGEFEESPPGEVSDPVGFDPDNLTSNLHDDAI